MMFLNYLRETGDTTFQFKSYRLSLLTVVMLNITVLEAGKPASETPSCGSIMCREIH